MCDKTSTALQILKAQPNHGGLSEAACMLFEQVIEDNKKTTKKVEEIHEEMAAVKSDVRSLKEDVTRILQIVEKPSWWTKFWDQYGSKIVLTILFLAASLFCKIAIPEMIDLWKAVQ